MNSSPVQPTPTVIVEDGDEEPLIPFGEAKFWTNYLTTAMRVCINLLVASVLFVIFFIIIWIVCTVLRKSIKWQSKHGHAKHIDDQLVSFLISGIKVIMWVQIIPILVEQVGIAVDSMIAVLGAITVGVGLSLRPVAENFVSGVILTINKPFQIGDLVELTGKIKGKVKQVGMGWTIVEEPDGGLVHVPNAKVTTAPMINNTAKGTHRLDVGKFDLAHGVDLHAARAAIVDAASAHAKVLPDPAPRMLVLDISQSAVTVAVRVWVAAEDQLAAPFAVREAVYLHLVRNKVPLAVWKPHVTETVRRLTEANYPGLTDGSDDNAMRVAVDVVTVDNDNDEDAALGAFAAV